MNGGLDIQITYATVLAAARSGKLIEYKEVAGAQGHDPEQLRNEFLRQTRDILRVCVKRDWPALTVIVVDDGAEYLTGEALMRFAISAQSAGYKFDDAGKFVGDQTASVFAWAPSAPDKLNPADGEILSRPVKIVGATSERRPAWSGAAYT